MRLQKAILTALICLFGMVLSGCYETDARDDGFYRTNRISGQVVWCSERPSFDLLQEKDIWGECEEKVRTIVTREEKRKMFDDWIEAGKQRTEAGKQQ